MAAAATVVVLARDDAPRAGPAAPPTTAARPNVLLITTDDQRADDMVALERTQELIGDEGTTFGRAYATFPLCCPARASILTGQYAHNHGVLGNGDTGVGGYAEFDGSSTLATWLDDAGYRTSFIGKYLNGYGAARPLAVPPGWDEFRASVAGGDYFQTRLYDGTETTVSRRYQTDLYAELSAEALTTGLAGDEPFFLWASFYAPHSGTPADVDDPAGGRQTPAVAPRHRDAFAGAGLPDDPSVDEADVRDKPPAVADLPRLGAANRRQLIELREQRLESLLAVDEAVGELMTVLADSGELADTIVIFTSDNGYMLGEHRIQAGKTVPYEPSARVPLLVRGPGFPAGAVREQPVALIDLAPTLVAAARLDPGLTMDGTSLLGPAADPATGAERTLLLEAGPDTPGGEIPYGGARSGRYVYVEYADGEREFYDLAADPSQLRNLATKPDAFGLVELYAARAQALAGCAGESCSVS